MSSSYGSLEGCEDILVLSLGLLDLGVHILPRYIGVVFDQGIGSLEELIWQWSVKYI